MDLPKRRLPLSALALLLAAFAPSCGYRPARFADLPPALAVADDAPIPLPLSRRRSSADTFSDSYFRHAIVDALDPRRTPDAGDVSSMDEVPESTWFRALPLDDAARAPAPPAPPLTAELPFPDAMRVASVGAALAVIDARGRRYLLRRDPPDRPEMRTAAEAIASRLIRALGYLTPDVSVIDLAPADLVTPPGAPPDAVRRFFAAGPPPRAGRHRVAAVRWPPGVQADEDRRSSTGAGAVVDLGPTAGTGTRQGDPNDRVPHQDRRTLRALRMVAAWLRIQRLDHEMLRDVYVGEPGRGHVEHHIVGLHGALGADGVLRAGNRPDGFGNGDDPLRRLVTFGLSPEPARQIRITHPSVGDFGPAVTVRDASPSPPFEPIARALPADEAWIAGRISALPPAVIAAAVDAGRLSDPAAATLLRAALLARQEQIAIYAFARVTPCELVHLDGATLVLRDLAVLRGLATAATTRYRTDSLSASGETLAPPALIAPSSATFRVPVDRGPLTGSADYVVVRVHVERAGEPAPRAMEVHVARSKPAAGETPRAPWRVLGVRR